MDYLKVKALYHDGIKGMKWGVRRYQNYDGTLTEEGKARYNKGSKPKGENEAVYNPKDGKYYYTDDKGNQREYKTHVSQLSDSELIDLNRRIKQENELYKETSSAYEYKGPKADQAFRDASKLANDISNALPRGNGKTIRKDYSKLSDQELRERIQRLQLEDSYGKLSGDTKYVKSGSEKAREMLQTAGAILAVASSAAILAGTIKDLRKPKMSQSDISEVDENPEYVLKHYGVLGQKWGVRKYQNPDGSLTSEGRARYGGKTHVDELDDRELDDLMAEEDRAHKRRLAIGIGVAITAATAVLGAAYIAKKKQGINATQTAPQVKSEIVDNKPKMSLHLAQPDTVKPNLLALPAPKASSSKSKPNIPDWLNKSGNSKVKVSTLALPAPAKKSLLAPKSSYDHRKVGKGVFYNDKRNYSRYEYFKDSKGNAHRILKSELRSVPRIHINHFDCTDYLIFREIYHSAFDELFHHGVKGQKWGVRRYQEYDGTLTAEGRQRYRTDKGTQEILENTTNYDRLTRDQRRQYEKYGRFAGAKRGFLSGVVGGALLGVGKTALDISSMKEKGASGRSIANTFTRNAMLGALGGSVIGTLVGSIAGKKSAQARYADKGRLYVDQLLNTPINRIRSR